MADVHPADDAPTLESAPRRFGRSSSASASSSPAPRRFASSRSARVVVALAILAAILLVGGRTVLDGVIAWIRTRPTHTFDLDRVEFIEPVPAWISGGRARLLAGLEPFAKTPRSIHDLPLAAIHAELSKDPWVLQVDRIESSFPNRLTIRLAYRRPVIRVDRDAKRPIMLDAEGVVLPEEVDTSATGPLVTLFLERIPTELVAGVAWPNENGDAEMIRDVSSLSGFLLDKMRAEPKVLPSAKGISIYPRGDKIWVELTPDNFLYWGSASDSESGKEASREEKWSLLRRHVEQSGPLALVESHFYRLTKDRVELVVRPKGRG
ncbi:MAG: hypothetical protein SFX72_11975 [Isosphaeraceae bacterium]|nr:hypothetical protein [Isosphaeraceae bacterium]